MQTKKEMEFKSELKYENRKQIILAIIASMSIILFIVIIFAYRTVSQQKLISEGLLLNILPEQTTIELKKFGKSLSKNHERVSIMFCDIKNFSHIAEQLSPHNVVSMLDYYFKNFDDILEKHGLEKIKTIGDAYMCAGGLHEAPNYSEKNIIKAATDFINFTQKAESEMLDKYQHAFHFRIGIHIGNVVSGVVGRKKFTYDIWGDAVNIAARMEQNSEPGKINVSGATYETFKNDFEFEYRGKIEAKNKGYIDMYFAKTV